MNPIAEVSAIALVSRTIIQDLKKKGFLENSYTILLASFLFNMIGNLGIDAYNGLPLTGSVVKAVFGTVIAAIYHDFNTLSTNGPTLGILRSDLSGSATNTAPPSTPILPIAPVL